MPEALGEKENALSNFFEKVRQDLAREMEETGDDWNWDALGHVIGLVDEMILQLDGLVDAYDNPPASEQEESVRMSVKHDLELGNTLMSCLDKFRELSADPAFPNSLRYSSARELAILNKRYLFETEIDSDGFQIDTRRF